MFFLVLDPQCESLSIVKDFVGHENAVRIVQRSGSELDPVLGQNKVPCRNRNWVRFSTGMGMGIEFGVGIRIKDWRGNRF